MVGLVTMNIDRIKSRFKGSVNVQHTDLKIPLFGRGGISEDLKSILITV